MPKTITLGDSIYTIDAAYLRGEKDFAAGVSYHFNPFRAGSTRADQWGYGHTHASEGITS